MLLCHDTMVISRSFGSFRVALRSEPIDAPASLQPLINFSLALKRFDVPNFDSGVVSLDLPVVFCNSVVLEGNPRRFAHGGQYGVLWRRPPAPDQSRSCLIAEPGACGRDNRKAASERKSKRAQNGQRGARAGRRRDSPRIFLRRIFLRCVISATTGFLPPTPAPFYVPPDGALPATLAVPMAPVSRPLAYRLCTALSSPPRPWYRWGRLLWHDGNSELRSRLR
jgi:hypothetical protein